MTDQSSSVAIVKLAHPKARRVAALLALCLGVSHATLATAANLPTPAGGVTDLKGNNASSPAKNWVSVPYVPITGSPGQYQAGEGKVFYSTYDKTTKTATINASNDQNPGSIIHWKDYNVDNGYTLNYNINPNNNGYTIINKLDSGDYTISGLVQTVSGAAKSTAGNIWFVTSGSGSFFLKPGGRINSTSVLVTNASVLSSNGGFSDAQFAGALNGISGFDITQVSSSQLPDIAAALGAVLWAGGATSLTTATAASMSLDAQGRVVLGAVKVEGDLAVQSASAITLKGNVTTDGAQSYAGAVTLAADTTLDTSGAVADVAADITFADKIDGAFGLTLTAGSHAVNFNGDVGHDAPLTSLSVSANAITLPANVITTGAQAYTGPITLQFDTSLDTTGAGAGSGADITFNAPGSADAPLTTIDGAHSLTLTAGSGAVAFNGDVGHDAPLTSLSVSANAITLPSNVITMGAQAYTGPITFQFDTSLDTTGVGAASGADITLNASSSADAPLTTIDGAHSLTLTAGSGAVTFNGDIGQDAPLKSLSVSAKAITLPANVITTGAQAYTGPITLQFDTSLDTTGAGSGSGADIAFNAPTGADAPLTTIDGAQSLTLTAGSGAVKFSGDVGATTRLSALLVNTAGRINLPASVFTTGLQSYGGPVNLEKNTTLSGSGVTFSSTVDSDPGATDADGAPITPGLTINAGTGAVTFGGAVGGATALYGVDVTAAGGIALPASVISTSDQTYKGPVTLAADTTLDTSKGPGNIRFSGSSSTISGGVSSLALTAGGSAIFDGDVGSEAAPLTSLIVSAKAITLPANVITTGAQAYTGPITLQFDTSLDTTGAGSGSGADIAFNAPTGADAPLTTIDGAQSLTLTAGSGAVKFSGDVGAHVSLSSLTVNTAGTINLPANVFTTGLQLYGGPVNLERNTTLNGSGVTFSSTVDSDPGATDADGAPITPGLTINAGTGAVTFGGAVGGTLSVSSLSVTAAGGIRLPAKVETAGAQTYTGPVSLTTDATLVSSSAKSNQNANITFVGPASRIDGAYGLNVNAGKGAVSLGGAIGSMTPLVRLSMTAAGGITLPALVATRAAGANDGSQSYTGPVLLVADTTLSSQRSDPTTGGNITFTDATSSVDGPYGLIIQSDGVASFGGAVGGKTALSQLVVRGRAIKVRSVRVNGAGAVSQSVGLSPSGAPKGD